MQRHQKAFQVGVCTCVCRVSNSLPHYPPPSAPILGTCLLYFQAYACACKCPCLHAHSLLSTRSNGRFNLTNQLNLVHFGIELSDSVFQRTEASVLQWVTQPPKLAVAFSWTNRAKSSICWIFPKYEQNVNHRIEECEGVLVAGLVTVTPWSD